MSSGNLITTNGRIIAQDRLWNAVPTYSEPSTFEVGTGTTTPLVTDTDLQTSVYGPKVFASGYPVLDETTLNTTVRCLLLTTEANGNSLTEFGIKNTDGTPMLFSHAVHTAITKSAAVQVIYIEKDKIT